MSIFGTDRRFSSSSVVLICLVVLSNVGCGVGGNPGPYKDEMKGRFINQSGSSLSEAEFQVLAERRWHEAQVEVAIHAQSPPHNPPQKISDPDPVAMDVEPINVTVVGKDDVDASVLNALPNCQHCPYTNPTGFIKAPPNNFGLAYTTVYMDNVCTVVVPKSHPEYMGPWEFSNCILTIRGKDISWR
jgi:hypothetical protein